MFTAIVVVFVAVGPFCTFADESTEKIRVPDGIDYYVQETPDQSFARADANGDGKLDQCEFPNRDRWVAQSNNQTFNEFDTNGDGFVTKDEQNAYLKNREEEAKRWQIEYVNQTIKEFDINGDQKLQQTELATLLKTRYYLQPRANFTDIFAKFDTDGDKGINIDELGNFEQNIPWEEFDQIEPATVDTDINIQP